MRVKRRGKNQCWLWTGGRHSKIKGRDYGVVSIDGKKRKAHQQAWIYTFGPIPKGKIVCHTCDNPPCCNPNHFFAGTHGDNQRDCLAKGRGNRERGADRYNATLTEADVREIRRRYKFRAGPDGGAGLAKEFGVGKTMISAIVNRQRWKHVI